MITLQNMWVNADLNFGFVGGPGVAKGHHDPVSHSWEPRVAMTFANASDGSTSASRQNFSHRCNVKDPSDPDHTVLDNTLVFVCSEISDGANHNSDASPGYLNGKPQPATYRSS